MMTRIYKNETWLKSQLQEGKSIAEIATSCGVDVTVIDEYIRRHKLQAPAPTIDLSDKDILEWCGRQRRRIPPDVSRATALPSNATVAILGADGFVGTNLHSYLKSNTAYNVMGLGRNQCDAMDRGKLEKQLNQFKPDAVINLAAFVGGIGLNRDNPADMIYRNIIMSANVVDTCFTIGVRKLIYLGTVCSYPHTPVHIPFVEDDLWDSRPEPTNEPYGVAKKTIGLMLDAYKKQFNFSSVYLIPTNMYGPHDDFSTYGSHVIPAMIRKFVTAHDNNTTVTNWGDGSASRDFLYVDDCCEAIKLALEKIDDPVPINIGSGFECTMDNLSRLIAETVGYNGTVYWDSTKPNGQPRRCLDTSRAQKLLGFSAKTDLSFGIRETVRWYLSNYYG